MKIEFTDEQIQSLIEALRFKIKFEQEYAERYFRDWEVVLENQDSHQRAKRVLACLEKGERTGLDTPPA